MNNRYETYPPQIQLTAYSLVKESAPQTPHTKSKQKNRVTLKGAEDKTYAIALHSKKEYASPPKLGFFSRHRATVLQLTNESGNKSYIKVNTASLKKQFKIDKEENEETLVPWQQQPLAQDVKLMSALATIFLQDEPEALHAMAKIPNFCVNDFGDITDYLIPQDFHKVKVAPSQIKPFSLLASGMILYRLSLNDDKKSKREYITEILSQFERFNKFSSVPVKPVVYDLLLPHLTSGMTAKDLPIFLKALRQTILNFEEQEAYFYQAVECFEQHHELDLEFIWPLCVIHSSKFEKQNLYVKTFLTKHLKTCDDIDRLLAKRKSDSSSRFIKTLTNMKNWLQSIEENTDMLAEKILEAFDGNDARERLSKVLPQLSCDLMQASEEQFKEQEERHKNFCLTTFRNKKLLTKLGNDTNLVKLYDYIVWSDRQTLLEPSVDLPQMRHSPSLHVLLLKHFVKKWSQDDSKMRDFLLIFWQNLEIRCMRLRPRLTSNIYLNYLIKNADTVDKTQLILDSLNPLPKKFTAAHAKYIRDCIRIKEEIIIQQNSHNQKSARKL